MVKQSIRKSTAFPAAGPRNPESNRAYNRFWSIPMKTFRAIASFLFVALFLLHPIPVAAAAPHVLVLTIDGAITTATREYLIRGIQTAEQEGDELIVLQLNTPGGGLDPMQKMAEAMRASTVPVVVYITPRGAWAGSAGTIITLAAHAAAMAPETAIGAASPVGSQGEDLPTTEQTKVKQIMEATVRSLAEQRGQQAVDIAVATIESAKAVSASEALQAHLVDFIANDLDDLLRQLDGFTVQLASGPRTLHTAGMVQQPLGMSLIEQLLQFLVDPNIVFLLLAVGVQALLIELTHPGAWVPAFVGVVCLALATYGMGILSVNWFGLIFIITAFVLFILDIKTPTHGALTVTGVVSFIVRALVLFNSPGTPRFERVSIPLVVFMGGFIGAIFAVILGFALRAQRRPVITGMESLGGQAGVAVTPIDPVGQVQAGSELWSAELAEGAGKIERGDTVEVVRAEGLRLKVRKKNS
jgi:membrane-bound serine protease (ClpP class)